MKYGSRQVPRDGGGAGPSQQSGVCAGDGGRVKHVSGDISVRLDAGQNAASQRFDLGAMRGQRTTGDYLTATRNDLRVISSWRPD